MWRLFFISGIFMAFFFLSARQRDFSPGPGQLMRCRPGFFKGNLREADLLLSGS